VRSTCSATTGVTIAATASQEQRISVATVVLSVRWASQVTTSSKSRVNRASGRAYGTCPVHTLPAGYERGACASSTHAP
jgi:hypothetical protein